MFRFIRNIFRGRSARTAADSTPLSEFVRASAREKKKVYDVAMKRASDSQRKVIERNRACA
jgi:hypothetical protein